MRVCAGFVQWPHPLATEALDWEPTYSPDFNPKEGCISKVKAELKRVKANTVRKLRNALRRAYAKVTLADIRGWFRHCGYSVP